MAFIFSTYSKLNSIFLLNYLNVISKLGGSLDACLSILYCQWQWELDCYMQCVTGKLEIYRKWILQYASYLSWESAGSFETIEKYNIVLNLISNVVN